MRKSYILCYATAFAADHKALTEILDSLEPSCDWTVPLPQTVLFTSKYSAQDLATHFEQKIGIGPGKFYFIAEALAGNMQGRLPERAWRVLNNPANPRGK